MAGQGETWFEFRGDEVVFPGVFEEALFFQRNGKIQVEEAVVGIVS